MTASNAGNKPRVNDLSLAKCEILKSPCVKLSVPSMLPLISTAGFQDFSPSKYTHWPTHPQPCLASFQFSSDSVVYNSLWAHGPQHAGLPVHHQLPEFTQTHVHWVSDAIQPSHPLLSPSPPAFNLSQHQGLFKWVRSLHQVVKVLEFQLQHQSFQWIFRVDFL